MHQYTSFRPHHRSHAHGAQGEIWLGASVQPYGDAADPSQSMAQVADLHGVCEGQLWEDLANGSKGLKSSIADRRAAGMAGCLHDCRHQGLLCERIACQRLLHACSPHVLCRKTHMTMGFLPLALST